MQDESIITITCGRGLEGSTAPEAAIGVLEAFLAKDFLLQLVLFLFVVRVLLGFEPPELVGKREVSQYQREFAHLTLVIFESGVSDSGNAGLNVGLKSVQHGVDLADGGVTPVHFLSEVLGRGGVVAAFTQKIRRMYQHAAAAAGGIVNGVIDGWLQDAHQRDGLRWHIRCFDHAKEDFRDFNLARFTSAHPGESSEATLDNDPHWTAEVRLRLVPHPAAEHPDSIRLDYDIIGEAKYVELKACLVGYFLRQWNIDVTDSATGNPKAQHLYLENKHELLTAGVPAWSFAP